MKTLEQRVEDMEIIFKYRNKALGKSEDIPIEILAECYRDGERLAKEKEVEYRGSFYMTLPKGFPKRGIVSRVGLKNGNEELGEPMYY